MSKVIIIGGGAAGMFAALGAVDAGHQVTILEPVSYPHLDVYKRQ